jgi:hypothetical protein
MHMESQNETTLGGIYREQDFEMTREEKNTKEKIPRQGLKRRSHKEILEEVQKRRSKR